MENNTSFKVEMHPNLPIMMTKFEEHFVFANDAMAYTIAVKQCLDAQESPVYYVFDLTQWHRMSFGELIQAAAQAARGKDSNFHHANNLYTLIVTHDSTVSKSAQGMTSDAYGNAKIKVFSTIDAALEFTKMKI